MNKIKSVKIIDVAEFNPSIPPFRSDFEKSAPNNKLVANISIPPSMAINIIEIMKTIMGLYHAYFSKVLGKVIKSEILSLFNKIFTP